MAKKIYISEDDVENIVTEIRSTLSGMRCYGSIDIKRTFKTIDSCAAIYFTPIAWAKMVTLVARYDTEVQWHGCVRRVSEFEFEVFDIIVPPHEVTSSTVVSEYQPYSEWLNNLDDNTFNSVKFHGHSHVNMGVTPSSTDEKYRLDLITQLPKPVNGMDVFYIFMIINKRHQWSAEIYDFTHNLVYTTSDIAIDTIFSDDGDGLEYFMTEAKKVAITRYAYQQHGTPQYPQGGTRYPVVGTQAGAKTGAVQPTHVTPAMQAGTPQAGGTGSGKHGGKKNEKGKYFGYDTIEEYYAAIFGEDEDAPISTHPALHDDSSDPRSPFYVNERGYT